MKLNREDIKKMVVNQMLQEGVLDTLKKKILSSPKEQPLSAKKSSNKKLETVADFLQMAQRSKELSDLILKTKVGQAIFGQQTAAPSKLEEILSQDFAKMMRSKGLTDKDLDDFVSEMSKNTTAQKMLAGLGLTTTSTQPQPATEPVKVEPLATQQAQMPRQPEETELGVIDTSGGDIQKNKPLDQQFLRGLIKKLQNYKKANQQNKKRIMDQIFKDLKNMAQTEGEKDLQAVANLQEILIQEMYNVLTGKNK